MYLGKSKNIIVQKNYENRGLDDYFIEKVPIMEITLKI
jgi:hypothetical protein